MNKGLVALAESKTAITNYLGATNTRFYPVKLKEGTSFPACTFRTNGIQDHSTFDGDSNYEFASVDIHVYAKTSLEALNIWQTLRDELVDSEGTYNGVEIDQIWYVPSGVEDYLDELSVHTKQLEIKIAYRT